jgi:hypothetical protein
MYCDFCGKRLSYGAKYCRFCGRQLKDPLGDTLPLPVIDDVMLHSIKQEKLGFVPWHRRLLPKKPSTNRSKVWRILYDLFSLAAFAALLYILVTFKTIKEYQILTGIWGGLVAVYIWWKR